MTINLLCCTSTMQSGGSERQMLLLLNGLDRSRITPSLYLTYRSGALFSQIPQDVNVDSFATEDASRYAAVPGLLYGLQIRKLRNVLRSRQIQVTYDRLYHTVMLGAMATYRLPIARVVTVVSPPSQDFGQSHQRWKTIKRKLLAASYRSATELLAVSEESANDAAAFYSIPIDRWTVIPSPIDFTLVKSNAAAQPPAEFKRAAGLNIAVVGRLSAEKNHQLLFQLVADLKKVSKPVHLHVIGDGILREQLQSQIKQLDIEPQVTFYGSQPNPHAILGRCDCLALPSLYEGFPNVVMEAMACGVPVIASSRAGGLKTLLGDRQRGVLLDPEDYAAWRHQLEMLSVRTAATDAMINAATEYVQAHHDLPRWMRQMEDVFIRAANKTR